MVESFFPPPDPFDLGQTEYQRTNMGSGTNSQGSVAKFDIEKGVNHDGAGKEDLAVAVHSGPVEEFMEMPYNATNAEVLAHYQADPATGLSHAEVETRRHHFGRNALKGRRSVHPLVLLLQHLLNVMSLILFVAVALALAVQEWIEAGVIGFIIVLNTVVGFAQEYSSEKTMQALRRLSSPLARVIREGRSEEDE
ncbi:na p-type atpase [Nannochloropsis gaditana]|uniref:Na P-type atpase n=1 Tax=Nannochloropsis gaditana TaxID=72520 RepID=W7TJJ1_9STRA|nr:na p-type atpase [Nannochloropsis gaditana]